MQLTFTICRLLGRQHIEDTEFSPETSPHQTETWQSQRRSGKTLGSRRENPQGSILKPDPACTLWGAPHSLSCFYSLSCSSLSELILTLWAVLQCPHLSTGNNINLTALLWGLNGKLLSHISWQPFLMDKEDNVIWFNNHNPTQVIYAYLMLVK